MTFYPEQGEKSNTDFIRVPKSLLKDTQISQTGKLMYGLILCLSDNAHHCYAGDQYLADELGLSVRQAKRTLAELEQSRVVLITGSTRSRKIHPNYERSLIGARSVPNPGAEAVPLVPDPSPMTPGLGTDLSMISAISVNNNRKENRKEIQTLNVVPAGNKVSPLSRRQAALAEEAIRLTGDEKSRKRYQQLAGIVVEAGREDLWDTVFQVTEARLRKTSPPLGAPGAYFCGTLAKLLLDAGVYAPVGSPAERADVQAQIAASFKQAGGGTDR